MPEYPGLVGSGNLLFQGDQSQEYFAPEFHPEILLPSEKSESISSIVNRIRLDAIAVIQASWRRFRASGSPFVDDIIALPLTGGLNVSSARSSFEIFSSTSCSISASFWSSVVVEFRPEISVSTIGNRRFTAERAIF
jgi:hypothetical protein